MTIRITRKQLLTVVAVFLLVGIGMCLGNCQGSARGFRHGQKITNAWWIGKQSRYFDSTEVEKKRRLHRFDLL